MIDIAISIGLFVAGLILVIYFAEKLVKGAVGTSIGFGISAFIISVVFIGFDPENLAVGAVGSFEGVSGIALGSIIGATMVAIALAFGITALLAPMRFEQAPKSVLIVPILAVLLLYILSIDGVLSRIDGLILFLSFVLSIAYLLFLSKRGIDIKAGGEVEESLEEKPSRWKALALMLISLVAIVLGSEMIVRGSETIIAALGFSDAFFGMVILAFLISIEELARELPAARRGRAEISFGNVAGSTLAFFLFNAGVIALVSPVSVGSEVLRFYLPLCFITVLAVSALMATKRIGRLGGVLLVLLYVIFVAGGYIL